MNGKMVGRLKLKRILQQRYNLIKHIESSKEEYLCPSILENVLCAVASVN